MSHPRCTRPTGHTCQQPSGRTCIEAGCDEPAGTLWGPVWCPEHDAVRLDQCSAGLAEIEAALTPAPSVAGAEAEDES